MRPQIRRATLPPGCWWIVHVDRGRPVVILDESVPRGSIVEEELATAALRMWHQQNRRGIGVFPASTVAAALVALAALAASIVYVLTGDSATSSPPGGWAEGSGRPVVVSPVERRSPAPPVDARQGTPRPVRVRSGEPWSGRPAPAPTTTPAPESDSASPAVRRSLHRPVKTVRRTLRTRPRVMPPVKSPPGLRPCELLKLRIGRCR